MAAQRTQRLTSNLHTDPKFGRLVLVSLVLHLLVVLVLGGYLQSRPKVDRRPVYYVDLLHKPVLNPQAGRPDPRPSPKPKAAPVQKVQPAPVKAAPVKPAKPAPKKTVKPVSVQPTPTAKPKIDVRAEQNRRDAIAALREKQAREERLAALKQKLNNQVTDYQQAAAATVAADVPVGTPDGTGDEVGVSTLMYVQAFIQQQWALSPYLLADPDRMASIEARVLVEYRPDGALVRFRMVDPSGDSQFDESIKRAITKAQQLPQPLPKRLEAEVVFNLKEMAQARR